MYFLIFREIEFSSSSIKKISYIFLKESFCYIAGKGNPEKILYISGRKLLTFQELTFLARKTKKSPPDKLLIFWEMELSSLNVRNFKAPS